MTVITNKRTLLALLLLLLGILFVLLGLQEKKVRDGVPPTESASATARAPEQEPSAGNQTVASSKMPGVSTVQPNIMDSPAVNSKQGDDFFVEYRLERDRVRSRQTTLLREIVDNPNSVAETRQEAQRQLLDITKRMEQELELENLIEAKGYREAVLFIQPSGAIVVVRAGELKQEDQVRIADMVSRVTNQPLENITIIPKV